jgi:cytochrome c553
MKKAIFACSSLFFLVFMSFISCSASSLPAGDAARGQALFSDTSLGTNGKACNTCHTDMGKGEKSLVGKKPSARTIRKCIKSALKGDPSQDQAVADLKAYIESLK